MWVEFVIGSLVAPRVFLRFSDFPPSTRKKTTFLNSNSIWIVTDEKAFSGDAVIKFIIIIIVIIIIIIIIIIIFFFFFLGVQCGSMLVPLT